MSLKSMQTGTQAIDRAAQLLVQVVEAEQPPTVGELAGSSGLPKSTVSRLLRALERNGLVQREGPRGGLRPGPVLVNLARRDGEADLIELAGPELRRLADRTGETVNLAVPGDGQAEYLA
ncbi:MAG: helix-turn-helix domain-containing protein, partial [Actinomycetota bacterium]|nr:helix-turn-helix domain-containing protein [Actinomycetota bacterium]